MDPSYKRGRRIRLVAFVTHRQYHNLLASAMMGLQAVNEPTQASQGSLHGCWAAGISMPLQQEERGAAQT